MIERTGIITFKGNPMTLLGEEVKLEDKAKDFTVLANDMSPVKLSDYKGKVVVLSVFPSVDTGVCSIQATKFNEEIAKFSKDDVQLMTISADLPFALGRFCADKGIENAKTTSDHRELEFGNKYGFIIKELKLLTRGTVIVDREGNVKYVEYVPEVATEPDYGKALSVVKELI